MAKKAPHVSIVIPTLNEEENIGIVLDDLRSALKSYSYELVIVDGHSKDKTVQVASKKGARIIYDDNGKGSALRKGFAAARGDIIISMDADLSNESRELRLLIDSIEIGYDIAMGSRFITGGGTEDMPLFRVLGNKFFVGMVNLCFGAHYSDMCYGYRSFRKGIVHNLALKEDGFGIETEININAAKHHLKVIEIPSNEKKRRHGEAKLHTYRDGYIILRTILRNLVG